MPDLTPATPPVPPPAAQVVPPPPPAAAPAPIAAPATPAGWYDDGQGRQRWFDGTQWTDQYAPVPAPPPQPVHTAGPATASQLNVNRQVIYNRQQKGHSLTLWIILSLFLVLPIIGLIYYSVSPNHYWHA